MNHVLHGLEYMLSNGASRIEVDEEAFSRYNEVIDRENELRVWGCSEENSWYKNKFGRVSQNWPLDLLEYWVRTQNFFNNDYELDN